MGGYAPLAQEESVRPRRLGCASGRPLNFTVRPPVTSVGAAAYVLVFGLFGLAFSLVAASQYVVYRVFTRFRTLHTAKWEEFGAPRLIGGSRNDIRAATSWLSSPEAAVLGDAELLRQVRLARTLNYLGGAFFLCWLGLWAWSVFT